ncbi:hypothetical protein [Thermocrinis minervae]|uniref:MetA-pathway of phenol degradation n=1 Tax=Thermocrinis minervae TaxID=381751 RepID=A0A1M6SDY2_9AQUI|nr:hypothetical protein [Thermocrinis minervae]SHK42906.1 hypothetical protein SAMN05444391_0994 [Thermocrinis minervae]
MKRVHLLLLALFGYSYAFYPFTGEDTRTLGKGGKQVELNTSYFRNYDGTKHTDFVLQSTFGITDSLDIAVGIPYYFYRFGDGVKKDGLGDVYVFVKHVPIRSESFNLGYRAQVNFDTGKRDLGYGTSTYDLYVMLEFFKDRFTTNLNLVYLKHSHVGENIRDARGFIIGEYVKLSDRLTIGGEFKYLIPEDRKADRRDMHILIGGVYSAGIDVSFGLHKSINHYDGFADWGLLVGLLKGF